MHPSDGWQPPDPQNPIQVVCLLVGVPLALVIAAVLAKVLA